ncbi:MAG: peptidase [Verrucomicrobia bacterium]|nr:peptidase [Verrucomicrobiota bacterium]
MSQVAERAGLKDNGVLLEFTLPATSRRLDCMFTGRDRSNGANALIVELKQWERAVESDGDRVLTFVGGAHRDVLHPSAQVGGYCNYLSDSHTAFHPDTDPISLTGCSYLHNYVFEPGDSLNAPKFAELLREFPLYSADDSQGLIQCLNERLGGGRGAEILNRIERSKYRPSPKLLEHVSKVIEGRPEYVLLDEQIIAFDQVLAAARRAKASKRKNIVLVIGGPGTGKSVIALNLLAKLAGEGFTSHYATGSKSFTETLREIVGKRAAALIKYFNSYTELEPDALDVVICDEAHRIRTTSSNQYTPAAKRTGKAQIDEIVDVARTAVFFIDDRQIVRPAEIGSTQLIRQTAQRYGATIQEINLEAQFRCGGSDGFIQWVDNTLEIARTPSVIWNLREPFEFKIFDTPQALDTAIRGKLVEGARRE